MLIQTSKSLNYGQRKPRQWGPISAVQYAVRVNAERMGIDYSLILELIPTWENAGETLYGVILNYAMGSGVTWAQTSGLLTDGSASGVVNLGSRFVVGSGSATIILRQVLGSEVNCFSLSSRSSYTTKGYEFLVGGEATPYSARLRWQDDTGHFQTNGGVTGLISGSVHQFVARFTPTAGQFFVDGVYVEQDTRSGPLTNTQNLHIAKRGTTYYNGSPCEQFFYYADALTTDQIAQLHATPYALLMPVSRPIFFDLGSGGLQLTINNCSCTSSLSTPSLLEAATLLIDALSLQSSAQNMQLDLATILQVNSLAASATLAQANLVQKALLEIANLASTSSYSQADLLQAAILQVATLQVASQFTSVALLQKALLSVQGMLAGSFLSALSLSNASLLDVANLTVSQQLATLSLAQKAVLQLSALAVTSQLSSVGLLQDSQLAVNPMTVASWLEAIQLSSGLTLSVANLASSSSLSSVELLQKALLAMQQMQVTSNLTESQLSVAFELVVDSLLASGTISSPTLGVAFLLLVDNLGVASIIDNIQLGSEKFQLLVDSLLVGQTYSNISLVLPSDGYCLVITANSEQFTINATVEKFTIN